MDGANANFSLSFGSNFYLNPAGFDLYSPNTIQRSNKQCGSAKIGFSLNSGKATLLFQSITFPLEKQAARKFCLEIAFPQNILAGKASKISFHILRLEEE